MQHLIYLDPLLISLFQDEATWISSKQLALSWEGLHLQVSHQLLNPGPGPELSFYRDPDFCTIFPDGNSSELDDGEFLEEEEKEGKSGMDPSAPAFQPREVIEDVTTEEGEEEWCFLGQGSAGWEGSESGGSSFKGDGSHESSEKRGAVRGVDELQLRSGSVEDGHTDVKTEDAGTC